MPIWLSEEVKSAAQAINDLEALMEALHTEIRAKPEGADLMESAVKGTLGFGTRLTSIVKAMT